MTTLNRGDRLRLAFLFFGPPTAWVLQLVIGYGLASYACVSGSKAPFYALSIAAAAIAVAAGLWSFISWQRRGEPDEIHLSALAPPQDFIALVGVLLAIIFLVLIGATGLYGIALNPCSPISMTLP